jgi:GNAT superfamily N-acetyltransferase
VTPVQLDTLDRAELARDAEWWRLYNQTFPPTSREPAEVILRSLDAHVGVALRARAADETVGLATLQLLHDPPAVFLVYLAVNPAHRSTGIGHQLFECASQLRRGTVPLIKGDCPPSGLGAPRPPSTMIWELDPPSPENPHTCNRRLKFFQRHGGQVLPRPYVQPPVDGVTLVPMLLMSRPVLTDHAEIDRLVRAIYYEKYAAINQIPTPVLESLLQRPTHYS